MRLHAVNALEQMARTSRYGEEAIADVLGSGPLDPQNRALLFELVQGVTRRRITIDRILTVFSSVKLKKVHVRVLQALRIAVYQLVWLDRVPPSAAVNESVEIVKGRFPGWIVKFANGCLRAISRDIDMKVAGPLDPEDQMRAVPIDKERNCLFETSLFPDPDEDPIGSLSLRHGYSPWLVERWLGEYGEDTTKRILRAGNEPPSIWLRPTPGRLENIRRHFERRRIPFEVVERPPQSVHLVDATGAVENLPGYHRGWFVVQDRVATLAAPFLRPEPGDRVLDLCAAPGGKATHLAELVGPTGSVVALDRDAGRLARLSDTARRLGLSNVAIVAADARDLEVDLGEPFDRVLVDVPCSNTGVLAKRAEARHRIDAAQIEGLNVLQREILRAGIRRMKPGGSLVYSTCSIMPEENRRLAEEVAAEERVGIEADLLSLPLGGEHDGGYLARIR